MKENETMENLEIETTEPEIETTEPEVETTEPEVETTEPEVKSAEQEVSETETEKEVVKADKMVTVIALQTVRDGETGKIHKEGEKFQIASSRLKGKSKFIKKV